MKYSHKNFSSEGYLIINFDEDELLPIKEEIHYIKNNVHIATKVNDTLAGHLDKEYSLMKSKSWVEKLIIPSINEYVNIFGYPEYINDILSNNCSYYLDKIWVNFQQKYEFNPIHHHTGIFSFVIWINNPYGEEERKVFKGVRDKEKRNGCFEFLYTENNGFIRTENIFTDKSYNGKGVLFPSMINHCVYPFYSSDDYRISVSGNIKFKV